MNLPLVRRRLALAVAVLAAIGLTCLYPISEDRAYQIREELERRRGRMRST